MWQARTRTWPWLAGLTAVSFVAGWWLSPPTSFAPEDCLVYRDMIVVQQQAIGYLDRQVPHGTVLTAWPAAAELSRPELGYTDGPIRVASLDNFTADEVAKAAAEPGRYDTALVFPTAEIAVQLGGHIVFQAERGGEWAAVLRFPRSYEAGLARPPLRP